MPKEMPKENGKVRVAVLESQWMEMYNHLSKLNDEHGDLLKAFQAHCITSEGDRARLHSELESLKWVTGVTLVAVLSILGGFVTGMIG